MQGLDWCEFVNQYCDHSALHVKPVNLQCKSIDSLVLSWWASSGGLIITVLHIEWGLCSDIVEAQCKLVLKWDACKAETSKVELAKTGAFWCEGIFSCDGWVSWNGPSKLVNQSTSPSNPVNWSTGPPILSMSTSQLVPTIQSTGSWSCFQIKRRGVVNKMNQSRRLKRFVWFRCLRNL